MGQIAGPVYLVQTEKDVDGLLDLPIDAPVAYVTQTTLSVDDTRGIIAALQAPLHRHRRARDARHLLRDAEPADRGARTQQARRRDPGGRRQEQLEFQPPARDRRGSRHAELSHRRRQRTRPGMAARRANSSASRPGASAPEVLVEDVIEALRRIGPVEVSTLPGREENVRVSAAARTRRGRLAAAGTAI